MNKEVNEVYRKMNRFDDLDIFKRACLMNTGEYEDYLLNNELETYKQALLDIKSIVDLFEEYPSNSEVVHDISEVVNKALGDKDE